MLIFDSELYPEEAIKKGISDYKEIATIEYKCNSNQHICFIVDSKFDMEITKLEFCNYVLHISASRDGAT